MGLSKEHLEARRGRITSARAAACLGHDPQKSPIDAWLEIKGLQTFDGNKATERGNRLEHLVLDYGAEVIGADHWEVPPFLPHPELPWAGDSCDAIYYDDWGDTLALGEGKTCGMGVAVQYAEEGTDQIPLKVGVQALWHLIHYPAAPYCAVPILVGGYDFSFRMYRVDRDEARQGKLLEQLARWHRNYIVADVPPPVGPTDASYIQSLHPRHELDLIVEPSLEIEVLVHDLLQAKKLRKTAESSEALAANRLRQALGAHEGIRTDTYSVLYRRQADGVRTHWQAVAEDLMDKFALDDEMRQTLLAAHTTLREGNRPLTAELLKSKPRKKAA